MSAGGGHVSLYRHLTRLYPPEFRHNYGADLVMVFAKQIEDEPPARVWARTFRDLVVTVPTQQLEAHMKSPSHRILTSVSGVVAGSTALLALTVGTGPAMPVFLIVALLASATALWSWQAAQPVRADNASTNLWWKFLLAGFAIAGVTFVAMAIPWPKAMDLGENAYWLVVIAFATSVVLAGTGLLLGIMAGIYHRRARRLGTSLI